MVEECTSPTMFPLNGSINGNQNEQSNSTQVNFKVIVLGDSNVGKSSIIDSFVTTGGKAAKLVSPPTISVPVPSQRLITMKDDTKVSIQLYDIMHATTFESLDPQHCKYSVAAFIVFDITKRVSFTNLHNWVNLVK